MVVWVVFSALVFGGFLFGGYQGDPVVAILVAFVMGAFCAVGLAVYDTVMDE